MKIRRIINSLTQTSAVREYVVNHQNEFVFLDNSHLDELHECFVYMLKDIDAFFSENGLRYSLIGGSLLGKIRHNGFIPWDDDFDIVMPRKDVEKLKRIFEKTEFAKKYDLRGPGCKKGAEVRVTKIYKKDSKWVPAFYKKNAINKIFVDIFVLDYVPKNPIEKVIRGIISDLLIGIIGCVEYKVNGRNNKRIIRGLKGKLLSGTRNAVGTVFSISSLDKWYKRFNNASYYKKKSDYCTIANGRKFYFGEIAPTEYFLPFKKTDFCGVSTWIMNQPENYLKHFYGDYMRIPDESEREVHYVKKLDVGRIK